jgi:hypothetical protein
MKHLLVLMIFVTAACSSAPKTENKLSDSAVQDEKDKTSTVEVIQACISSAAISIMSAGDSRAIDGLCKVTPESRAMWDKDWVWNEPKRKPATSSTSPAGAK